MTHKKRNPGAVGAARGAGSELIGGSTPKHTAPSQAEQHAWDAPYDLLVRPKLHQRLLRLLDGRQRVEIRGARDDDPVIVLTLESSEASS
jgi:hypothetical protein